MMPSPRSSPQRAPGAAPAAIHAAVVAFVGLILLAMRAYPGGTAWDRATRGNDFWLNYLCDLERAEALDGEPNRVGAALARAAVIILALGLLPLFWSLPRLFETSERRRLAVRGLGCAGALGGVAVGLLPNDRFGDVHVYAILCAGLPSLAAAVLAIVGMARAGAALRGAMLLGSATLIVSVVDLGLYLVLQIAAEPAPPALAVLERCALILALSWMWVVARSLRASRVSTAVLSLHAVMARPPATPSRGARAGAVQPGRPRRRPGRS
jgi:hypothetical protein